MLQNLKRPLFVMSVVPSVLVEGQLVRVRAIVENIFAPCKPGNSSSISGPVCHHDTVLSPHALSQPKPPSGQVTVLLLDICPPSLWRLHPFIPPKRWWALPFSLIWLGGITGWCLVSEELVVTFSSRSLFNKVNELSWCWQSLATSCMGASRASVRSILYPADDTSVALLL